MKTGMRGTVTAISTAEMGSAPATTPMMVDRDDDGQEELGQVAREVAVERVDAGRERARSGGRGPVRSRPAGPRAAMCAGGGAPQLRLGRGRSPVRGPFGCPGQDGAPGDHASRRPSGSRSEDTRSVVEEGIVGDRGDEPGLGDDQERGHSADEHGEHDEAPGGPCVAAAASGRRAPTGVPGRGAPVPSPSPAQPTASFRRLGTRFIGPAAARHRRRAPPRVRDSASAREERSIPSVDRGRSLDGCSAGSRCRRGSPPLQHGSGPPALLAPGGPDRRGIRTAPGRHAAGRALGPPSLRR